MDGHAAFTGHYKLLRQTSKTSFYAEVFVTVTPHPELAVGVSETAFAWLKDVYGPDAWEWSICDAYRSAARLAAKFAITHLAQTNGPFHVSVDVIRARPADTMPDSVALAVCKAIWAALDDPGTVQVHIEESAILFDGKSFTDAVS